MSYDFRGRVVLVTGASSGIGRATAQAFARAGASVALTSRNLEQLEAIAAHLRPAESKIAAYRMDVTDRDEVVATMQKAANDFGQIDILVNNAGIGHCLRFEEIAWEDMRRIVDTNLLGVMHCIRAVIPLMRAKGGGQIVNISSTVGHKGVPMMSIYCATKFAVRGLTESLRMELRKDHIELIGISPGTTDTDFFNRAVTNGKGWWLKSPWKTSPDTVAQQILRACFRHKREVVLTPEGRAMVILNKIAPRFVDFMTMKVSARE